MTGKYEMIIEGRGRGKKRKVVKTTKKRSGFNRWLRVRKRQAWNLLGLIGCAAVVWWLIQLVTGGG